MASPFTVFRKNQKLMLAALTLLAMVGFVILPTVQELLGSRSGSPSSAVVTTTRYGDLTQRDLQSLEEDRQIVLRFLQELPQGMMAPVHQAYLAAQEARQKADAAREHLANVPAAKAEVESLQKKADELQKKADDLQNQIYSRYARMTSQFQQLSDVFGPPSEESVVETWLLENRAREMGLTLGDDAINDFINRQLLEDPVTREPVIPAEQVRTVLDTMNVSENRLFHALGRELLALRVRQLFFSGLQAATPGQRWDYYKRLNRKATVELVALPVSKFTAQVATPSEDTLRDFFNRYANKPYNPASPEPGFQVPKKVDLQYFKGEYGKVVDPAAVPAQEVKDYYESHKEDYKRTKLLEAEPSKPGGTQLDAGPGSLPGLNAPASPTEPAPAKTGQPPAEPAADQPQKPATAAAEKVEKPAVPAQATAPPQPQTQKQESPQPPNNEAPKVEKESQSPKSGSTGDTSAAAPKSPFRLVAFQEEKPADSKDGNPAAKPAEKTSKAKTPEPAQRPETKDSQPAGATKVGEPAAKATDAVKPPEGKPVQGATGAASPATAVEYIPLSEVEKEIRENLARARAEEMFNKLREQVSAYAQELSLYDLAREDASKTATPPKPLDFNALAKQHNLSFHETGLISAWEARRLDIAQSNISGSQGTSAISYIYEQAAELRPEISQDAEGNYYLFWIREKTDQREPKFDEPGVRAQVLETWKMIQARELALKQAEQLVAEARQAGKSLKEDFAGRPDIQVIETEPFTWLTASPTAYPWMQVPPQLSQIKQKPPEGAPAGQAVPEAVEMPGEDFMRAVFNLEQGGVGVAMNQPKTIAYVVRVVEFNPKDSVLEGPFFKADYSTYYLAAREDRNELLRSWIERLEKSAGLKWQREPIRTARR